MHASILEQSCSGSRRRDEPESGPKLRIRHENTNSRRFLAPNSKNFIENEMSCRSNVTISSTVSSPGYFIRDEIDPSTYSFTTALKALQARSNYSSSSEGLSLNSKWSDAEKYICNPLSGEVPLECLSAKTLSSRSFSSRITMSAPLINYPPHKSTLINHNHLKFTLQEKTKIGTRDVGIQSTLDDVISSDSSSFSPSTEETSRKETEEEETGDSSVSSGKQKPQTEVEVREKEEGRERKKVMMMWRCDVGQGGGGGRRRGCGLSLKGLWQRDKSKSRHNTSSPTFHYHINACFNE